MAVPRNECAGIPPTLETDRLLLREILPADAPALFGIQGSAERVRWFAGASS